MTRVVRSEAFADPAPDPMAVRSAVVSAFEQVQQAVLAGQSVVLVVPAADLVGQGGPERGALAGALVGLARAVAFEGARPGWTANVLALPAGLDLDDEEAARRVPEGASGQVVTLGTTLAGKVAS